MTDDEIRLKKLDDAIATGATSITHRNKTIQYRKVDDMIRVRNILYARIHGTPAGVKGRVYAPTFDRAYR